MVEDNVKVDNKTSIGKTSVFLAWSGSVSQKMAGLLKDYLPLFVRNIAIFMSEDITKGKRWHTEIANALGSTKFGILCLTHENLASEWIHFEAGALSKTIDDSTHVCPLLLDVKMSELKEPLASFHATLFDKEEFKKLVKALAQACGDSLEEGQFNTLMEALWPKIDQSIKSLKDELAEIRKKIGKPEDAKPKVDSLLEEVVVRIREQGRLLATLTEQSGTGLGKEILLAVQDFKMVQQHTMDLLKMNSPRRLFRIREEDDSVRRDLRFNPVRDIQFDPARGDIQLLTRRMKDLADILQKLPFEITGKHDPESTFDILIQTGLLSECMLDEFGGRKSTIEAIDFLIHNPQIK
jgi:hypothetical protein